MIRKSGNRFSEKIMPNKKIEWDDDSEKSYPDLGRRQPFAQRGQHGKIRGTLSGLVLERGIGAAREQQAGDVGVAAFGRDHQRGAATIVPIVDMGAGVQQV